MIAIINIIYGTYYNIHTYILCLKYLCFLYIFIGSFFKI